MRYLDPKADLTFKKVFGEHPDLVISFLNALLPFDRPEEMITDVEYLPSELVSKNPLRKNSIVDVRCRDVRGRQFIVEMQMVWSSEFKQRVMFNASKAYVRQLGEGEHYELLQPVYSLNLVNDVFEPGLPDEYYHYYRMVHVEHTNKVIDGLHLIFVELPKFTPHSYSDRRMLILWLRYLTEIGAKTRRVPDDLLESPEIRKAVDQLEESAFTEAQLLGYEKFWDMVSVERTLMTNAERKGLKRGLERGMEKGLRRGIKKGIEEGMKKGMEKGMEEGMKKGMEKGMEKGIRLAVIDMARNLKKLGLPASVIAETTGLSPDEIDIL